MTIPSLPMPAVVALMLVVLVLCQRHRLLAVKGRGLFVVAITCYVLSLVLISLRWSYDWVAILPWTALLSALSSVFLYLAYRSLSGNHPDHDWSGDGLHALPIAALILALLLYRPATDFVLPIVHFAYAWLLLKLAWSGPDASSINVRLDQVAHVHRAIYLTAILLMLGGVLELVIMADFIVYQGRHAATIVGYMNVPVLFLIGATVTAVGTALTLEQSDSDTATDTIARNPADLVRNPDHPVRQLEESTQEVVSAESELLPRVKTLLLDRELYTDSELTLRRLARRAGVPERVLSREINEKTGSNVSQWVNEIRIQAVCNKLRTTDCTITEAMLSSGFSTKSNFNREFRRVTGQTPSEWRRNAVRS